MLKPFLLAIIVLTFFLQFCVANAYTFQGVESFESYTNGDSLVGKTGGTGWSGAWSSAGTVSNASPQSGSLSGMDTNQACLIRSWADSDDGSLVVWVKNTSNSDSSSVNIGYGASYNHLIVLVGSGGNVKYFDGSAYQTLQAYSSNTYIKLTIEWDRVSQASKWRMKVGTGEFTSWMSGNGSFTYINKLVLCGRASGVTYFDDIGNNYVQATTTPPTATTTPTTSDYDGPNLQEWLFVMCTGLFFISLATWGKIWQRV